MNELIDSAIALHKQGRLQEATLSYQAIIDTDPQCYMALSNLAILYLQSSQIQQGIKLLENSLSIHPEQAVAHFNLGNAYRQLGELDAAMKHFSCAIGLKADYADAYYLRSLLHSQLGDLLQALADIEQAIRLGAVAAEVYLDYAELLKQSGHLQKSLQMCDQVVRLNPQSAEAYALRAILHAEGMQHEQALVDCEHAIALAPGLALAHYNRGKILAAMHRHAEALQSYDEATRLAPDYANAQWNKALLKLSMGDYEEGWPLYAWRWKTSAGEKFFRQFAQPLWTGEQSLQGKTLLLHAEQGLGDAIQFCRYAILLRDMGVDVLIETPAPLMTLFESLGAGFRLVEQGAALPDFDLHCPMLGLPAAFKTTLQSIPLTSPYLGGSQDKREVWQSRLGLSSCSRIGLVWSGSKLHPNDKNRSIPLPELLPLLEMSMEFHVLQKEIDPADMRILLARRNVHVHAEHLHDMAETAGLLEQMDLVISVDTSIAHLAGALGKEVWILLPTVADFRWLLHRNDSPWYPSARLFRQAAAADWTPVIRHVCQTLGRMRSYSTNTSRITVRTHALDAKS